jgi:hypothetical protein
MLPPKALFCCDAALSLSTKQPAGIALTPRLSALPGLAQHIFARSDVLDTARSNVDDFLTPQSARGIHVPEPQTF